MINERCDHDGRDSIADLLDDAYFISVELVVTRETLDLFEFAYGKRAEVDTICVLHWDE